jgi:lambda family phage tail tape measure protein
MEDTLAEFIVTGENSFEDFADSVLKSLTKIVINQTLTSWLAGLGKQLTSATSGTAFGSILSAIFGSEHGNIFSGGRIVPFAKGGTIVFNPTLFPMANGTGLMGEAGPEAVLPLTRLSNGNLGVQAATSQTQPTSVSVQIKNESGQEQKIKNSEASWNGQELIVTVWLDAFQRNAFGLRTALGG